MNRVGRIGIRIDEHHLNLAPIARVNEARGVETGNSVICCESTSGEDEAGKTVGDRDSKPRRDPRPSASRFENHVVGRDQIGSGVTRMRVDRQCSIRAPRRRDFDHVAPYLLCALVTVAALCRGYPRCTVLAWMDLEMTGLDPSVNVIIEIATLVTTDELEIVAEGPDLVLSASEDDLARMDDVVRKMHSESGLLTKVEASTLSLQDASAATLEFLESHIPQRGRSPLCGNSIGVDRRFLAVQLPELDEFFHYRSIDVSTVKELCKRWSPALYGRKPVKVGSHRALDDVRESVGELRFYRDNFFRLGER